MKRMIVAAVAVVALVAGVVVAQQEIGTEVTITTTRTVSAREAGRGIAYQCVRDFNQCLRTIPNSTLWSAAAYGIEQQTCCLNLGFCQVFATDVANAAITHLDGYVEAACPEDESGVSPSSEVRRSAKVEALLTKPETVD